VYNQIARSTQGKIHEFKIKMIILQICHQRSDGNHKLDHKHIESPFLQWSLLCSVSKLNILKCRLTTVCFDVSLSWF